MVKEDIILKGFSAGFTLIEVLVAKSVLITILATFIPIFTVISYEQNVLKTRLLVTSMLHDEIQLFNRNENVPSHYTKLINEQSIQFTFSNQNNYVKGCAQWINVQKRKEESCLYGNHP